MINELEKWLFGGDETLKEVFDGIDIFLEGEWMSENEMKNTDCTEMADLLYDAEVYLDTLSRAADKDKCWLLKMRDAIKRAARIIGDEPVSVVLPTDEERSILRAVRAVKSGDANAYIDDIAIVPARRLNELMAAEKELTRECGGKRPIEARLHLCESCTYDFAECDATDKDICFGECLGRDNVIGCSYYTNKFVEIERQSDKSLRNCTNCCHNKVCGVVKHRKATKANDYTPCNDWARMQKDR